MADLSSKLRDLRERLRTLGTAVVAFSGGVDSTFLMHVAFETLGARALAATVESELHPAWEIEEARTLAAERGWRHRVLSIHALASEEIVRNPPDRCYHCKRVVLDTLWSLARAEGIAHVLEGTNADDLGDVRPGRRAVEEAGVLSPLLEAGLTKAEIRELSRAAGLPTWDKPAFACLASRIPFHDPLTMENLQQVAEAEAWLRAQGLRTFRVRHHGASARIEVAPDDIARLAGPLREAAVAAFRGLGFRYVTVDLAGYRMGNLNP